MILLDSKSHSVADWFAGTRMNGVSIWGTQKALLLGIFPIPEALSNLPPEIF
jgi:hypothetical protein